MRRRLGVGVLVAALLTLQTGGGPGSLLGLRPDYALLFVLAAAMRGGESAGVLWGVALGFLDDVFSAGLPAANVLTKGLLGFVAGSLREHLDCDNPNTQAIVAALATLAQGLVHLALLEVFSAGRGFFALLLGVVAPAAALNGALLPVALGLLRRVELRRRPLGARG